MYRHLLPDLKKRTLVDVFGTVFARGTVTVPKAFTTIELVDSSQLFHTLLKDFPSVIGETEPISVLKEHGVYHRLQTTGEPTAQKARRLSP